MSSYRVCRGRVNAQGGRDMKKNVLYVCIAVVGVVFNIVVWFALAWLLFGPAVAALLGGP